MQHKQLKELEEQLPFERDVLVLLATMPIALGECFQPTCLEAREIQPRADPGQPRLPTLSLQQENASLCTWEGCEGAELECVERGRGLVSSHPAPSCWGRQGAWGG